MSYVKLNASLTKGKFHFSARLEINSRITGVFGPSGSGKTTFMHLLAGLQKPDKGTIEINGNTYFDSSLKKNIKVHKRKVGYVFQEGRIFPHLNVEKNLSYGWKKNTHDQNYYEKVVDLLELRTLLKARPGQLSGGQKQRVAIGRALMSNAQLLLLDEPFTALDSSLKRQVISLLNKLIRHLDIPVIIVSHDLKDLLMLTQNIMLIKEGRPENPKTYLELINSEKLLVFNGHISNYYNIYDGIITENLPDHGLTSILIEDSENIVLSIESDEFRFHEGDFVKVSLRGADVALSLNKVENISIRNQLPGRIVTLFQHRNHVVCIVDCGIRIITRLTLESARNLDLEEGKQMFCLFKSIAIEAYR